MAKARQTHSNPCSTFFCFVVNLFLSEIASFFQCSLSEFDQRDALKSVAGRLLNCCTTGVSTVRFLLNELRSASSFIFRDFWGIFEFLVVTRVPSAQPFLPGVPADTEETCTTKNIHQPVRNTENE